MKKWGFVLAVIGIVLLAGVGFAWPRARVPATRLDVETGFVLIIDAGHGGEDGGTVSVTGVRESALNLAIASKTEDLAVFLGIPVQMIRRTDISVYSDGCDTLSDKKISDLKNRVSAVNGTPGAVLLSIHQNHFSQEKYRGTQVFYARTPGSRQLAYAMQSDVRELLDPKNNRSAKPAEKVYLMEHIGCTGVLVECGFLSNFAEEALLREDSYQKKLAMVLLRSIAEMERTEDGGKV